jgi:hypothetical protein
MEAVQESGCAKATVRRSRLRLETIIIDIMTGQFNDPICEAAKGHLPSHEFAKLHIEAGPPPVRHKGPSR